MAHIEKRKKASFAALARLRNLEILTDKTCPYLKGHLYKTFIMPVLLYSIETIKLTRTNINLIKNIEGKIIRSIYGIPGRCRTMTLKLINNLDETSKRIKLSHVTFFERLLKNQLTRELIKEVLQNQTEKDYITNLINILDEMAYDNEMGITEKCNYFKYATNLEFETCKKNNSVLGKLQEIFDQNNGECTKIFQLLRFDNPIHGTIQANK